MIFEADRGGWGLGPLATPSFEMRDRGLASIARLFEWHPRSESNRAAELRRLESAIRRNGDVASLPGIEPGQPAS
jgi:hypothetical protein